MALVVLFLPRHEVAAGRFTGDLDPSIMREPQRHGRNARYWRLFYHLWQCVTATYTRRLLTQTSDKLVALSGVVDILQQASDYQYLAGLWRSHLPAALLWQSIILVVGFSGWASRSGLVVRRSRTKLDL